MVFDARDIELTLDSYVRFLKNGKSSDFKNNEIENYFN